MQRLGLEQQQRPLASRPPGVLASRRLGVLRRHQEKNKASPKGGKKSRRRPTLARASPALPSAMEPLTSVFGMGTGVTTPLWPPAKNRELGTKENYNLRDWRSQISH